jgi:hypothetical protein
MQHLIAKNAGSVVEITGKRRWLAGSFPGMNGIYPAVN